MAAETRSGLGKYRWEVGASRSESFISDQGTLGAQNAEMQTTHRALTREDGAELRLLRRACSRLHLDQIRPHALGLHKIKIFKPFFKETTYFSVHRLHLRLCVRTYS